MMMMNYVVELLHANDVDCWWWVYANLDVIGDECMYIHIVVDYEELYGVVELYGIVDVDYSRWL
jgi:hypothetical protein